MACLIFVAKASRVRAIVSKENVKMKYSKSAAPVVLFALAAFCIAQDQMAQRNQPTARSQDRIQREVRHELAMLPYFTVFDNIAYKVDGASVTLLGQVVNPVLKSDAGNTVKHIEGVENVDNQIEVLPLSPMDNRSRRQLFRAIYGYPALQRYALGVQKPIRIIVKNGHVTLEGVVDTEADKNIAGLRANGVPGIFSVTNNLQVVPAK
jgi:hyperosmotically inducible periplasmic protein